MKKVDSFPLVYRRLVDAVNTLKKSEVASSPEVQQLFKICSSSNVPILDSTNYTPIAKPLSVVKPKMPFIVIEGLDGSGKSKVSTALSNHMNLVRFVTPPPSLKFLKCFFDEQRESVRRAYYSIGNYLVASKISATNGQNGIILDRYWHSTASYAAAAKMTFPNRNKQCDLPESWFNWPEDLLKPQVVLFLVVSEKIRSYRHEYRNTTNTKEEQTIASSSEFRKRLLENYRSIQGIPFIEIDADSEIEDVSLQVYRVLLKRFPMLLRDVEI